MKKASILISSAILFASSLSAEMTYSMDGAFLYNSSGSVLLKANYAVVAAKSGTDFSAVTLENGYEFKTNSWVNDSSDSGLYVFDLGNFSATVTDDAIVSTSGGLDVAALQSIGFTGSEKVALVAWSTSEGTIGNTVDIGTSYLVFNPETELSGGFDWILDSSNSAAVNWLFYSDHPDVGGNISWDKLALSKTVIPEPATYAVLFGLLALGAAIIRRRK